MLDPLGPVTSGDEAVLNALQATDGPDEAGQPGSMNGGEGIAGSEKSDDDALTLPDATSLRHSHPLDIPVQGVDDLPEDVDVATQKTIPPPRKLQYLKKMKVQVQSNYWIVKTMYFIEYNNKWYLLYFYDCDCSV